MEKKKKITLNALHVEKFHMQKF